MKRMLGVIVSTFFVMSAYASTSFNTVGSDDATAIAGFDVVAFFTAKKALRGDPKYSVEYGGAKWIFSSEENLTAFKAKPESYLPAWGGHCAWAVSEKTISTKKLSGDFEILSGKLYLFSFGRNAKSDAKDDFLYGRYSRNSRLRDGEQAWPGIKANLESGSLTQPDSASYTKSQFERP